MRVFILAAATIILLAVAAAAALAAEEPKVQFPDHFIVSTGTTIPLDGVDPISQAGMIYFDHGAQRVRLDHFFMGHRRSLVVDLDRPAGEGRAFLLSDAKCIASRVTGKLQPMGVPGSAVRDSEATLVRHVSVVHYQSFDRSAQRGELMQHDFYVRQQNLSATLEDGTTVELDYHLPWRYESKRSNRRELAPPPPKRPNWRWFGEDVSSESAVVRRSDTFGDAVARVLSDEVVVSVDFFDFAPIKPDPSIFEVPAQCHESDVAESFSHDVDVFDMTRHLTELSFNSKTGDQIIESINAQARRKKIQAGSAAAAAPEHPTGDEVHVKDL